ncbi:MAG: hypothetical protein IKT78_00385, partial [Ruminiclostridium sp.]|nr:hypothetical protein [Ruminiclostridium sp.]
LNANIKMLFVYPEFPLFRVFTLEYQGICVNSVLFNFQGTLAIPCETAYLVYHIFSSLSRSFFKNFCCFFNILLYAKSGGFVACNGTAGGTFGAVICTLSGA